MKRIIVLQIVLAIAFTSALSGQERFSKWGLAQPVKGAVGVNINTTAGDTHPVLSRDGLSLYFLATKTRTPNYGGRDIWFATRASLLAPWENPQNAGCAINSYALEEGAMLTPDNHHLYFASNRGGGYGNFDIYVSPRRHKHAEPVCPDDQGWQFPENLGPGVNTAANETSPAFFEDELTGEIYLYFARDNAATPNIYDIYVSRLGPDGIFGAAEPVAVLNSTFNEDGPFISKTGLELYFNSMRPGNGRGDLWISQRASTAEAWSEPHNLNEFCDDEVKASNPQGCPNTEGNEVGPVLSWDGTELYFGAANRIGNITIDYDLWVTRRTKLTGKP